MQGYLICCMNETDIDFDFGSDYGCVIIDVCFDRAVAKSIARHLNKTTSGCSYWVEAESDRWT